MPVPDRRAASLFTDTLIQLLVGVLLFVALLNRQRDLVILTVLILGIVGGTRLWARASLWNLKCQWKVDKGRVFPGEKITLTISAENAKPLPIWLMVEIPVGDLLRRSAGERILAKKSSLLWFERTRFEWELYAEERGVYQIGPLNIHGGDLFSFFSRRQRASEPHSIIVYPRLVPLKSFALPRCDFFGAPWANSPVHDPVHILGTRDYQHRQPAKYIHWKASARHDRLQEKIFEPTVQEKILLAVDVDSFAQHEAGKELERTLRVAASLAARLDRQGHSFGFVASGAAIGKTSAVVPVVRNAQHLAAVLETMARLEMKPGLNLKDLLRRTCANLWGIGCVYFSDTQDETLSWAKKFFSQEKIPVVFIVSQPPSAPEASGGLMRPQIHAIQDLCAAEVVN